MSGDYKYKKAYKELNNKILSIDLKSIEPKSFPDDICGVEVKKELRKAFKEIGLDMSITGTYHYYGRINVDYQPRFHAKDDYGKPLGYNGCVKMPSNVIKKMVEIILAIFPEISEKRKDGYGIEYVRMSSCFDINGNGSYFYRNDKSEGENRWKKTKVTKKRDPSFRRKPIVCDNQKCKYWIEDKKYGNCKILNGKGRRMCKKRLNPDNLACSVCGRKQTDKIVIRETVAGMICQYCRASDMRHIGIVKQLGGIPRHKGKSLWNKEDYYVGQ
jgi:hypothetical protein